MPWLRTIYLFRFNNGSLLPVFFNMHCQSGAFGGTKVYDLTERTYRNIDLSFSEALLRKEDGGAVGIIAASEISFSGANDVLTMEMFHSIWPKASILTDFPEYTSDVKDNKAAPVYSLGKILRSGVSGLTTKYKGWFVPYTKRIFHCFGDPSMNMYTTQPDSVNLAFVDINKQVVRTSKTVEVALIMADGSVKISHGREFDLTSIGGRVKKSCIFGHNIIPKVSDKNNIIVIPNQKSEITRIDRKGNFIEVRYNVNEHSNAVVSMKLATSNTDMVKVYKANGGLETISIVGFVKGVYIVELTENGVLVDCKKIII